MPEIRERDKTRKLHKSHHAMLTPKQAAKLLREKYRKRFQRKQEQEKESEATDTTEQMEQVTAHTTERFLTSAVSSRAKIRNANADRKDNSKFVKSDTPSMGKLDPVSYRATEQTNSKVLRDDMVQSHLSDCTYDTLKTEKGINRPVQQRHAAICKKSDTIAFKTREPMQFRTRESGQMGQLDTQRAVKTARHTAEQRMKGQAITQTMKKTASPTTAIMQRVKQAVSRTATSMIQELAVLFGVGALLTVLVVVVVIGAVTSSPFGLLFANENKTSDTFTVSEAVEQINADYRKTIRSWKSGFDRTYMSGQPASWTEVLSVFAVRYAGTEDGTDVAQMDADRISKLSAVFWDMTEIQTKIERIDHADSDPNDGINDGWTEYILYLDVIPKTADKMREIYGFTAYQNSALDEFLNDPELLEILICGA